MPDQRPCPVCGRAVDVPGICPNNRSAQSSLKEGAPADLSAEGLFPFCSQRCRLVDLGRWLDGEYRIPGPPLDGGLEQEAAEAE